MPRDDTCPTPVCISGTACALAPVALVAPLNLAAVNEQMLAADMSKGGLLMLQRASDLMRVAHEWERVDGTLVCASKVIKLNVPRLCSQLFALTGYEEVGRAQAKNKIAWFLSANHN